MNNSSGQRNYAAWATVGRSKLAFQPIFAEQTFALGLNRRKNWGQGRGMCNY
jgi:hypothetical protein